MKPKTPDQAAPFMRDVPDFAVVGGFGTYQRYIDISNESQLVTGLQALADGRIDAPIGSYRVAYNREGNLITLWSHNPAGLDLGPLTIDPYAAAKYRLPVKMVNEVLSPRLKSINSHVFVTDVEKSPSSEKWLSNHIHQDQEYLRKLYMRDGIVAMITPTLWGNDSFVYRLKECEACDIKGEKLYEMQSFVAPSRGWELIETYLGKTQGDLKHKFLESAAICSHPVTLTEGQRMIMEDAQKRAPRVVSGLDPYALTERPETDEPTSVVRRTRETITLMRANNIDKALKLRAIFAARNFDVKGMRAFLFILAVVNVPVAFVMWAAAAISPLFFLVSRISAQSMNKIGMEFLSGMKRTATITNASRERLLRKYCSDWSQDQLRGKLDEKWLPYLGFRDYASLGTNIGAGKPVQDTASDAWVIAKYISGSVQDPPGSVAAYLKVGNHEGQHILGSGGQNVTYIPSLKLVIGRMDWDRVPMEQIERFTPKAVLDIYRKAPEDRPYLWVRHPDKSKTPHHTFLSREEFEEALKQASLLPAKIYKPFPSVLPDVPEPSPSSPPGLVRKVWDTITGEAGKATAELGPEKNAKPGLIKKLFGGARPS